MRSQRRQPSAVRRLKQGAALVLLHELRLCAPFGRLRNAAGGKPIVSDAELDACTDSRKDCDRWARDGECESNPGYMRQNCRASCLECQSRACFDQRDGCESWADNGECVANAEFMLSYCAYSCGVCRVNFKAECKRPAAEAPAAVAGTIDATFRRAIDQFGHLQPRVLHRDPWIVSFDSFLTPSEADGLLAKAGHSFERSLAGDGVTPVRTSSTSWCNVATCLDDPLVQDVRARIANLTRVRWENAEHLQVPRYQPGQFYREHHDQNSPRYSAWGPRLYTFFMYLSDVESGGETRFTKLNISVTPRKGAAILWPSVLSHDPWTIEELTYHEAVAVSSGEKYAANFWIHMLEFQERLQKGCDNEDYYQEMMMGSDGHVIGRVRPKKRQKDSSAYLRGTV